MCTQESLIYTDQSQIEMSVTINVCLKRFSILKLSSVGTNLLPHCVSVAK